MYLNELDNFHFDLPSLGTAPQVAVPNEAPDELDLSALPLPTTLAVPSGEAGVPGGGGEVLPEGSVEDYPQIGSLSPADTELFKGVIAKYFVEDISSYEAPSRVVPSHASTEEGGDDVEPEKKNCLLKDNGFGIGIPETEIVKNLQYEEADTVNTTEIRKQFPILHQKVNGHDLVWFDNGATTQKPLRVIDGLSHFYKTDYSNIHRGAHTLAARSTDQYEAAREKVARFINAPAKENILFVRGTTEGINLVAQTYGRQFLTPGDDVIVSELDHHANIVPWQRVAQEKGATLRAIPTDQNGDLILSEFERIITPRTRFVSVGHVNNTFGTINDVQRIIEIAHSHNIPVLIDGAQSIAHTPVDVQALGADFFVFSGHKIYGPNGIGVVYGRKELLDKMQPWQGGGNMIKDVTIERTEYNVPPARFEAGTPNVADAIGLGAALDYVSHLGIRNIEHHEHQLTEYAREQLAQIPGLTLIGNPKNRVSVVSFVLDGIPVPETGTLLDKEGIAVRAGHHCAQPALRALGYEMSVRPTFALYNTREDVDKLVIAIRKIVGQK